MIVIKTLRLALEEEGYKVIFSECGEKGLAKARSERPDLILLDIMLPKMDGFKVCEALKSEDEYKAIPIIMLTGLGDTENIVKGFSAGANDYVSKPFHLVELLARVKTHIRIKETHDILMEKEREKSALLDVSQSLSSAEDPCETLFMIVSSVTGVIESKRCSIVYAHTTGTTGWVMASSDSKEVTQLEINCNKYPEIQKVLETREPLVINNIFQEPLMAPALGVLKISGVKSMMVFPIMLKDRAIGVLILKSPKKEVMFCGREIRFCLVTSNLAAGPLNNAYLVEKFHQEKEREKETRKAAEEQLRKLSLAIEQSPNIVVMTDTNGNIKYVNQKFTEITGYTSKEILGQNPRLLKSGKTPPKEYGRMWNTINSGKEWRGEFYNKKKNGGFFWESAYIAPIKNPEGKITHFVSVKEDITEKKLAKEREKHQKELLAHANRLTSIGTLTAGICHEINNPNHLVMLCASIIENEWMQIDEFFNSRNDEESGSLPQPVVRALTNFPKLTRDIQTGAERIERIVAGMRDFSRLDPTASGQEIQVKDLIFSAKDLLWSLIKESTDHFKIDIPDLPAIKGDSQKLEQVFVNLITNACHSLTDAKKAIEITGAHDKSRGVIILQFRDEGKGMDSETLRRVMEPFFTTKTDSGGTGLGVSISFGIIKDHGGLMEYQSEPRKGTVVIITLPVNCAKLRS